MKNALSSSSRNFMRPKSFVCSLLFVAACFFGGNVLALTYEMPSIFFKEKTPSVDGRVEDSLSVYDNPLEILKDDALAIPKLKGHFNIKIVGYTDNRECASSECNNLSLRRAQLIYRWMLAHGVPASQLLPPEGHGSNDPAGDNSTPVGRARNRRVEFQWVPISPAP